MPIDQILSILQQSIGRGSRSTALQPLVWLILVLALIFIGCLKYHASVWIFGAVLSMSAIVVLVYLGSYLYLIRTNIDATRSERFTLEKLALQQSRTGDDRAGFMESRSREFTALPASVSTEVDTAETK
jgi:hypothetical protein